MESRCSPGFPPGTVW